MIVVCGEALIDIVDAGDGSLRPMPGGGPFNTALALARLEVPASILGRLSFGAALLAWLHDHGALKADLAHGAADLESALGFAGAEHPRRAALMH